MAMSLLHNLRDVLRNKDGVLYWIDTRTNRHKAGDVAGHLNKDGYVRVKVFGKVWLAHRLVFFMYHGYIPKYVDHINGIRHDNRIENLRECSATENLYNRAAQRGSASGIKNVAKARSKWQVKLFLKGKTKSFGVYDDLELAELVAIEACNLFHGDFANRKDKYVITS